MSIKKVVCLFVFLSIIFTSNFIQAYYFDADIDGAAVNKNLNFLEENLDYSYVKITTIGSAESLYPCKGSMNQTPFQKYRKVTSAFLIQGVGGVIKGNSKYGYIITAAHVVNPMTVSVVEEHNILYQSQPIRVLERSIFITNDTGLREIGYGGVSAIIVFLDIENDIALLQFENNNIFLPIPYGLSYTSEVDIYNNEIYSLLRSGDSVAVIVRKRDKGGDWIDGFEFRHGKVISEGVEGVENEAKPSFCKNDFTTDIKLYPGDSGSPVFAFRKGKPVIIGVARASNEVSFGGFLGVPHPERSEYRSYATRTDFIKSIIESE